MTNRLSFAVAVLTGLLSLPASAAGVATVGPQIAELGNRALNEIRADGTFALTERLRDQIDLCALIVQPEVQTAAGQRVAAPREVVRLSVDGQRQRCDGQRRL